MGQNCLWHYSLSKMAYSQYPPLTFLAVLAMSTPNYRQILWTLSMKLAVCLINTQIKRFWSGS